MPKQPICNKRQARQSKKVDRRRLNLIEQILEESSSLKLNDATTLSPRTALEAHSKLLELVDELRRIESNLTPQLPTRDKASWSKFFAWLNAKLSKETGVESRLDNSFDIVCLDQTPSKIGGRKQEYGLVTKVAHEKDSVLFSLPRSCMMTTETAMKDEQLSEFIWNDSIASAMQNVVLVLHLMNEFSKNEDSAWSPYLAILPSTILPVLQLDKTKLNCLTASSHLFEALKMLRAIYRQYAYFFKRLQATTLSFAKDFTLDYYCWAVSIVCSRQNEIPCEDRKVSHHPVVSALIPILDMCNHCLLASQANFDRGKSVLVASKALKPGDEIRINYGSRTSGDFYIHNGFVPDVVPLDEVPLSITLQASQDPLIVLKVRLLKTLNMPTFGRFKLVKNCYENRHRRDPHLTMFLIVYCLDEEEVNFIMDDDNPVGVSDAIYEYVQYHNKITSNHLTNTAQASGDENGSLTEETTKLTTISQSILIKIRGYLDKRARVVIALIERTLDIKAIEMDPDISRLLSHERSIYETYLTLNNH